jgi:hypothetical protein
MAIIVQHIMSSESWNGFNGRKKTGLMGSVRPLKHCIAVVTDHRELMDRYIGRDRQHRA